MEAIRGDMGWSTFRERVMKAKMNYKIRVERMMEDRIARQIYEWNASKSKWSMQCKKAVRECGLKAMNSIGIDMRDKGWSIRLEDCKGRDLNAKEWKMIINERVSKYGLNRWKKGINEKETLTWYASKEGIILL